MTSLSCDNSDFTHEFKTARIMEWIEEQCIKKGFSGKFHSITDRIENVIANRKNESIKWTIPGTCVEVTFTIVILAIT